MKKFLLFVFMFMLVMPVNGLEKENTIRKYKYYRLEKVDGPYVLKTEVNDEYPLIDEENYIEGSLSEFSTDKPEEKEGRKIYEYDGFHYLKLLEANKVEIKVDDGYALKNISIRDSDGDANYNNKDEKVINGGSTKIYELNELYDFRDLTIKAQPGNDKDMQVFYVRFMYNDKIISEIAISTFSKNINISGRFYGNIKDDAYEDIYTLNEVDDDLIYKGPVKLYQYQDYKYQSYKLVRDYYDEYLTEPFENYIYKDEEDFIDVITNNTVDSNSNELVLLNNKVNEDIPVKKESKEITNTNNEPIKKEIKESVSSSSKNNIPTQSGKVINIKSKPLTNKTNNKNVYYYFLLVILIILLLLAIKYKNELKKQYG